MIVLPEYAKTLFIFNDNEEQFNSRSCIAGAGNAIIRPYQCHSPPRASGVPTGSHAKGYTALTPHVKATIDEAINRIVTICESHHYNQVIYSVDENGQLGTGVFIVEPSVKAYIVSQLKAAFAH